MTNESRAQRLVDEFVDGEVVEFVAQLKRYVEEGTPLRLVPFVVAHAADLLERLASQQLANTDLEWRARERIKAALADEVVGEQPVSQPYKLPEPEGPTNQDILDLYHAVFFGRLHGSPSNTSCEVDFARAVLARWGQ
jgi:hypothetical protein